MTVDIFVPQSSPDDAIVGQLHTVTYVTSSKAKVEEIFTKGYGLDSSGWTAPRLAELDTLNGYLGFSAEQNWESCAFSKSGEGAGQHLCHGRIVRTNIFVPVGPVDPTTGMGGSAYSAGCITATDETVSFLRDVLGFEIRRDVEFTVSERSALLMPEGTTERFIQAFAPGSATGYLVLIDHQEASKPSPASSYGLPNRGIAMWSFATKDIDSVRQRAADAGIEVVQAPSTHGSPYLSDGKSMILRDPDGFLIEIFGG